MTLNGGKLSGNTKMDRMFMFIKIILPQGFDCLCPRAKSMWSAVL